MANINLYQECPEMVKLVQEDKLFKVVRKDKHKEFIFEICH